MLFPAIRHETSFWSGVDRLVGDLVLPEKPGPHPVLVLVGSSTQGESERSAWIDAVAAAGIAVFTWDRPGRGRSGGTASRPSTSARAREVLAALNRLQGIPGVNPDDVVLVGWGTGGWAAAQAVTFGARVRGLITLSTPMVSAAELIEHRFVVRMREAGLLGDDVSAGRAELRWWLGLLADGVSPEAVRADAERYRGEPWYPLLPGLEALLTLAEELIEDPRPTVSAVEIPVLAMYGELDPLIPLERSVQELRATLRAAEHPDFEVAVVRGGDHGLRVRPAHGLGRLADGRHEFGDWPTGLTPFLLRWVAARLRPTRGVPPMITQGGPGVSRPAHVVLPVRQLRRTVSR